MRSRPMVAITGGDPCGIGPEVVLKALASSEVRSAARYVVIGDRAVFDRTTRRLRLRAPVWRSRGAGDDRIAFMDCGHPWSFTPGRTSREAGRASRAYLDRAIALWRAGAIQAIVTAPVTKWAIARSEPSFVGQTEYLAAAMRVRDVVMMFASDALRVALVTRHVPLRRVPAAVDRRLLQTTVRLTDAALRSWFRIRRPALAVCGLNPHAGESGRCGDEERRVIAPVLRALRRQGIRCEGPFAADGFFAAGHTFDAVICAYHDQGLIPFKLLARDRGCQVSIGLPIVRTSPDHGSALDIAGQGIAHPGSMRYALQLAACLAGSR